MEFNFLQLADFPDNIAVKNVGKHHLYIETGEKSYYPTDDGNEHNQEHEKGDDYGQYPGCMKSPSTTLRWSKPLPGKGGPELLPGHVVSHYHGHQKSYQEQGHRSEQ